jgi:hypothetical protein
MRCSINGLARGLSLCERMAVFLQNPTLGPDAEKF